MSFRLMPDRPVHPSPAGSGSASPARAYGPRVAEVDGLGVRTPPRPAHGAPNAVSRRRTRVVSTAAALVLVAGSVLVAAIQPAGATVSTTSIRTALTSTTAVAPKETRQQHLVRLVNLSRTQHGLKPYAVSSALSVVAQQQAHRMASQQRLFHNANLTTDVHVWHAVGENVAYTSSVARAHSLLMNSPPHRANLLSRSFTQVGVGIVVDSHRTVWVVEVFRKP
jgi:uncharacterized protein YkwD